MSIQLDSVRVNNPYGCPPRSIWSHGFVMEFLGFNTVRDRALTPATAPTRHPESDAARMAQMGASAQRQIDQTIHSHVEQIHAINPELAETVRAYPKTYQVASCLGRILRSLLLLPVKSAKNVAFMIYQTLKAVAFAVTHPVQAANKFLQALLQLVRELKKPEIWGRIGASVFGTGAAQLVSGNPLAATMMLVGLSLTGASLFIGALCELAKERNFTTKSDVILSYLKSHTQEIPETVMTAFLMTLLMRAFQTASKTEEIQITIRREYANVNLEEATQIAQAYANERGLGKVFYISIDQSTHSIGFTYWRVNEFGTRIMQGWGVPLPFIDREVMTYALKIGHPSVVPATVASVSSSLIKNHQAEA